MPPDELEQVAHALAAAIRRGELKEYTQRGVLPRLRYEAATGRGRPRSQEEWDILQRTLTDFRHAEDGDRVRPEPFAPKYTHADEDLYAPPGSDNQVLHNFTRQLNQQLEDEQLGEMVVDRMGSDTSRKPDRVSLRDNIEAAYEVHAAPVPATSNG
jgi:hypothetical protein